MEHGRRSGGTRRTRVKICRRSATENGGYARNVRRSPFQSIPSSLSFPSSRRFLHLLSTLKEDVATILGEVASDSARSARWNGELEISSKKPPDAILSHLSLLPLHLVLATENNGTSGWNISRRSTSITSRTVDGGREGEEGRGRG